MTVQATAARPRRVIAYQVSDDYEGRSEIVFHSHAIAARRIGANCLDTEFDAVSCRRAPWADQYAATGTVPVSACIAQGWRFEECCGCGAPLDDDTQYERGLTPERAHGTLGGAVFCCIECAADDQRQREAREEFGAEVLARLREKVRDRFGEVEFETGPWREHVYVTGDMICEQAVVSFRFPGQKVGAASLRWGSSDYDMLRAMGGRHTAKPLGPAAPVYFCCNGDKEAFEAWAEATRVPSPFRTEGA